MADEQDPTSKLRKTASALPSVTEGTSCNQTSFKVGKRSFLYVGPGPKGAGFKAMFKLESCLQEAQELATEDPDHFEVGSTGWVTTRFSSENPLSETIWQRWLEESYDLSSPPRPRAERHSKVAKK